MAWHIDRQTDRTTERQTGEYTDRSALYPICLGGGWGAVSAGGVLPGSASCAAVPPRRLHSRTLPLEPPRAGTDSRVSRREGAAGDTSRRRLHQRCRILTGARPVGRSPAGIAADAPGSLGRLVPGRSVVRALADEELRRYSVAGRRRLLGLELHVFDGELAFKSAADGLGRTLTLFTWSILPLATSWKSIFICFSLLEIYFSFL